jgi:hypothetical protein
MSGLGEVELALKSFQIGLHLNPAEEELRNEDLDWARHLLSQVDNRNQYRYHVIKIFYCDSVHGPVGQTIFRILFVLFIFSLKIIPVPFRTGTYKNGSILGFGNLRGAFMRP